MKVTNALAVELKLKAEDSEEANFSELWTIEPQDVLDLLADREEMLTALRELVGAANACEEPEPSPLQSLRLDGALNEAEVLLDAAEGK